MPINIQGYIKICPKCGSTNIESPSAFITVLYMFPASLSGVNKDTCKNCNYQGIIPEIEKSKIEDFKKEIQKIKSKQ